MGLLKKIELANNFSSVERILGKYVLENGEKVLNMSTKELAKATFTSPASIVRFCRKLEYEGYNDFKIALAAQLQYSRLSNDDINANYPFLKELIVFILWLAILLIYQKKALYYNEKFRFRRIKASCFDDY